VSQPHSFCRGLILICLYFNEERTIVIIITNVIQQDLKVFSFNYNHSSTLIIIYKCLPYFRLNGLAARIKIVGVEKRGIAGSNLHPSIPNVPTTFYHLVAIMGP
jgi:hypothetical protein